MSNWSLSDYKKHLEKKQGIEPKKKRNVNKSSGNKQKEYIDSMLRVLKLQGKINDYVKEHKFLNNRKFRMDWAIPEYKICIEYEGIFSTKSGHRTITGVLSDIEKYNLATMDGWKVLRYTAKNYEEIYENVEKIIENEKKQHIL